MAHLVSDASVVGRGCCLWLATVSDHTARISGWHGYPWFETARVQDTPLGRHASETQVPRVSDRRRRTLAVYAHVLGARFVVGTICSCDVLC